MLESIAIILVILWLLGVVTSFTLGGLIHVLLVIAIVTILLRLIGGH
ncbi:lmo0937 family membrane protein [Synechococcus sp. HJ21-Hayes]|nr:lmo0937 family membrane protein [Synechococcus sp. JJ3a-Johnson]MCP9851894.1 lmo0937 family membrane protein [Synechococcus sp. HJ21-Hayes]